MSVRSPETTSRATHKVANKGAYDQIVGEMGIESTYDNPRFKKTDNLRSLAMIIIYVKTNKFVDKEDFLFTRIIVSFLGRNILIIIKQD